MVRLGFIRQRRTAFDRLTARSDATANLAGGLAFEISDPSIRLLTMVGSSFFDEPTYYDGETDTTLGNPSPPVQTKLSDTGAQGPCTVALSPRTQNLIATALEVSASEHPRDLLAIAHWARREMNIRTTPCILLAVAASQTGSKPFVRTYCRKVISRADELRQVFAAYVRLFGRPLPNSLKRGLADAFERFDEFSLLRYNTADHPTFADVLMMIDRGRDKPIGRPLFEYLVNSRIIDPEATPLAAARQALARCRTLDDEAKLLAIRGRATWESLVSQFGNRREVWELMIEERLIPYMALLRNLRNILRANVDPRLVNEVSSRIEEGVADSRQLPFRFLSAYRAVGGHRVADPFGFSVFGRSRNPDVEDCDRSSLRRLLRALENAVSKACESLPRIPGTTLIAADNSGSMSQPVSRMSFITAADAANLLCVMAAKLCERSIVCAFGTDVAEVRVRRHDDIIASMGRVAGADTRGWATNAWRVFRRVREQRRFVDRVILLSDMQCWNSNNWYWRRELAPEFVQYRDRINPDVWLHSVDLVGHGHSTVPADMPRVNLTSGFSEKILTHILMVEGIGSVGDGTALPTIEYIRERF